MESNTLNTPIIKVSNLYIYPIKSCQELKLNKVLVSDHGLLNDRILVIIKRKSKRFLTMRTHPLLYSIIIEQSSDINNSSILSISIPNNDKVFHIDVTPDKNIDKEKVLKIKIWEIPSEVYPVETENNELNKVLSDYLKDDVILVKPVTSRKVGDDMETHKFTNLFKESDKTHFADLAPILITSVESFNYMNKIVKNKGEKGLQMLNFRPNIVLEGGEGEFWEDKVDKLKIGNVIFRRLKGCTRCKMTTFDLEEKKFRESNEPLTTLNQIRFDEKLEGVIFGQNYCVDLNEDIIDKEKNDNVIKVGDEVFIIIN